MDQGGFQTRPESCCCDRPFQNPLRTRAEEGYVKRWKRTKSTRDLDRIRWLNSLGRGQAYGRTETPWRKGFFDGALVLASRRMPGGGCSMEHTSIEANLTDQPRISRKSVGFWGGDFQKLRRRKAVEIASRKIVRVVTLYKGANPM